MSGLFQIGVKSVQLNTKELGELYYNVYNPDTAVREPLGDFENVTSTFVRKGEGEASDHTFKRRDVIMAKKKLDPVDIAAQQRAREQAEVEQAFLKGITTLRDLIAPSSLEIHSSHFRLGTKYGRTLYVYGYPRQIYTGWLSSIINIDEVLDISMFIYPVESQVVLNNLRKKVTQLEASMSINSEKGKTRDPGLEAAIQDAEELRDQLQVGSERFFRYGLYITLYADSLDELSFVQHKIETIFGQQLVFSKVASIQQEQGLNSTDSADDRPVADSPQHEHRRYLDQFSVHQCRPDRQQGYPLRHQYAQQWPSYL